MPGRATPLVPDPSLLPPDLTRPVPPPLRPAELRPPGPEEPRTGSGLGPEVAVAFVSPKVARPPRNLIDQTQEEADAKSVGCRECHKTTDAHTMHVATHVVLGCTDCHGGNAKRGLAIFDAHVQPEHLDLWPSSANPPNSNVALNHESPEFIRFINPGDLRAAKQACGFCHGDIVERVGNSMMNHGAMLWNAAAYNNGAINIKNAIVGMAYGADGIRWS